MATELEHGDLQVDDATNERLARVDAAAERGFEARRRLGARERFDGELVAARALGQIFEALADVFERATDDVKPGRDAAIVVELVVHGASLREGVKHRLLFGGDDARRLEMPAGDPSSVLAFPFQGVVLALDSTLGAASVALARGGVVVDARVAEGEGKGKLASLAESLLASHALAPRDLEGLVVGVGPGRFTGVRSAVAVAKGLAWALAVPVAAVGSLEALAVEDSQGGSPWLVLGDGPRNLYVAPRAEGEAPVGVELASFVDGLAQGGAVCVRGAALAALRDALHEAGRVVAFDEVTLDAAQHLAAALRRPRVVSVHELEPLYVREASVTPPKAAPPLLPFR